MSWIFARNNSPLFCYAPVFTPQECDAIIEYGKKLPSIKAQITTNPHEFQVNDDIRSATVRSILPSDSEIQWVFHKLERFITTSNYEYYNFDIFGITEDLQLLEYNAPNGKYTIHTDDIQYQPVRKLSVTVNLSDHSTYEGGELQLHRGGSPAIPPRMQGTAVMFPSHVPHCVTTMTKGTRFSLVAWVSGPPLR